MFISTSNQLQALDNSDDKSIEENSRTFVGIRQDWTKKLGFRQPILNGVAYEIAFCASCKVLLDTKHNPLNGHWNGRDSPNGACQKRRRDLGLSQPELEGEEALQVAKRDGPAQSCRYRVVIGKKATLAIQQEIQKVCF